MGKSYLNKSYPNDRPKTPRAWAAEETREAVSLARQDAYRTAGILPAPAPSVPARREEEASSKRKPALPQVSHEQRTAERAMWRHACDWLELHHLCANTRCHRAGRCRGEPIACLRARIPQVPEAARQFVRRMIEGQELCLPFEEAFEDAGELQDGWSAWIAGLEAAAKARPRQKGPERANNELLTKR
jgi:hypothetical protein